MTARLLIEYDGTDFAGWASQPGQRTVQGELERALRRCPAPSRWCPAHASRAAPIAGVHALGQVASYEGVAVSERSLNALLADDVAVLELRAGARRLRRAP